MASARLLGSIVLLACAGRLTALDPPSMPAWLVPFPGATAQTSTLPSLVVSRYQTTAPPADVIAYYRTLFEGAGLPFHPGSNALATTVQGDAPECALMIHIQKLGAGTSVNVSCTGRFGPPRAVAENQQLEAMKKFDQPVHPRPKVPLPPLVWPAWLVSCDGGGTLEVQKGVDQFKLRFLKAEFTSQSGRDAIQSFYVDLLNSHDYPVWVQSSTAFPLTRTALVEGAHLFDGNPGPKFAIRVQLTPVEGAIRIELRMTAQP